MSSEIQAIRSTEFKFYWTELDRILKFQLTGVIKDPGYSAKEY